MSNCCDRDCAAAAAAMDTPFRKALWIALAVNAAMFGVEIAAGLRADSVSLLADAVDFFGDAANYGVSLFVLALAPVWRSRAALAKGLSMGTFGLAVLALSAHNALGSSHPDASTMGGIGLLALVMTPIILTGGIDLSVGSTLGLCAVMFGKFWRDAGMPPWAAGLCTLGVGALCGLFNGVQITRLRLPPLIVTLGTFSLFRGLAEDYRRRQAVAVLAVKAARDRVDIERALTLCRAAGQDCGINQRIRHRRGADRRRLGGYGGPLIVTVGNATGR